MSAAIKGISSKQLSQFLPSYKGTKLTSFPKIPMFFSVKTEGNDTFLTREFLYDDFKEAFPHYSLLAKSCAKLQYFP